MKIAYLMSTYPMTSTTFIVREIEALERLGVEVERYAMRRWHDRLVDSRDIEEAKRTRYFLNGNLAGLLSALLSKVITDPRAVWSGILAVRKLAAAERGFSVRHFAYLLEAIYLVRKAREDGITHVHAHFATNATAVAMLSRLMGGPSYSFTAHGPNEFDDAESLAFDDKLSHALFAIAISNYCKVQLIRHGGFRHASKIHIVHCGVNLDEFSVASFDECEPRTFVCVGRLTRDKAQVLIPAAVARLKTDFPDLKVILIGDGEERRAVEAAIATHQVEANVEIRGWLPNQEVRNMIRKSQVLLLPSFAEGLPIVIMEALAVGRPVISTYIAGIPELLDSGCGWIIPAGSVDDLAEAMRQALASRPTELARLGMTGRARVVADFELNSSARMLLGHFEAAISAAVRIPDSEAA